MSQVDSRARAAADGLAGSRVRARNRRRILAAVSEFVGDDGFEHVSMRQLADVADVSVRTLYNLFDDRNGLIRALVLDSIADINLAVDALRPSDPIERAREVLRVAMATVVTAFPRAVLAPVLDEPELLVQLSRHWDVRGVLIAEIRRAQVDGELHDDVDAELLVDQVGIALLHWLREWASGRIGDDDLVAGSLRALDVCLLAIAPPTRRAALSEHVRRRGQRASPP